MKMSKSLDRDGYPERLRAAAAHAKVDYSPTALGKILGVNKQTAATWMAGSMPRGDKLFQHADKLGVDPRWLATGRGDMLARAPLPAEMPPEEISLLDRYRACDSRWKLSLRLLAMVGTEDMDEVAESVNLVIARIFAKHPSAVRPVSDERVEQALSSSRHGFPPGRKREPMLRAQEGRALPHKPAITKTKRRG